MILVIGILFCIPSSSFAHKLIPTYGSNNSFDDALVISDHKVSWVVYEEINDNELYYTFTGKKGDMFFASIVIPKIENLKNFSPSLAFIGYESHLELIQEYEIGSAGKNFPYKLPDGYGVYIFDYSGSFPSKEFYEPFGQITYWERQEIDLEIEAPGTYYMAVFDKSGSSGKLALAIGYIEDFSGNDFVTVLPNAWLESRYFSEDFTPLVIFIGIVSGIFALIGFGIYRKIKQ